MAKEKNLNVKIGKNEKGTERKYEVWNGLDWSKHAPCKEHSDRTNENQLKTKKPSFYNKMVEQTSL